MIKGVKKTFKDTFGKKEKPAKKTTPDTSNEDAFNVNPYDHVDLGIKYPYTAGTTTTTAGAITHTSGYLQTLPTPNNTFATFVSFDDHPIETPSIKIYGDMVHFYFEKGSYSMPLKDVKKYGHKVSIVTAYMKAEKNIGMWYGTLVSSWIIPSVSSVTYYGSPTINTTIGTVNWVAATTTGNVMYTGTII